MGKTARKCVQGFPKPSYLTSPFLFSDFPELKSGKVSSVIIKHPVFTDEVVEHLIYITSFSADNRLLWIMKTILTPRPGDKKIVRRVIQPGLKHFAGNFLWHLVTPPFVLF
jgi:hypothetical protein